MRRTLAILLLSTLAAVSGCRTKDKKSEPAQPTEPPPARAVSPPAPGPMSEAALQALLDEWLEAQNLQSFDRYAQLYASKFMGTKRAGSRLFRFDRAGWLEDRKAMFKKEMLVTASERQLIVTPSTADVQFIQRWKSGPFEDVGTKRLLVVVENGALKIAREEMLASEVVGSPSDLGAGSLLFIVDGGLYLEHGLVPTERGNARLVTEDGANPVVARATVREEALDGATLAWKGQKVRVDESCEATVTGFHLVSRITHHFGTLQTWHCTLEGVPCEPTKADAIAQGSFEMGRKAVIAELDGCHDGLYARRAAEPRLIRGSRLTDPKLTEAALAAFSKLPNVVAQREKGAKNPDWWKGIESVSIFEHPVSRQVLVSVSANNRRSCGDFTARAWQVWQVEASGLVPLGSQSAGPIVPIAVDLDGDGKLELLARPQEPDGNEWELVDPRGMKSLLRLDYAYNDCPC